jgi:hypothetical protein
VAVQQGVAHLLQAPLKDESDGVLYPDSMATWCHVGLPLSWFQGRAHNVILTSRPLPAAALVVPYSTQNLLHLYSLNDYWFTHNSRTVLHTSWVPYNATPMLCHRRRVCGVEPRWACYCLQSSLSSPPNLIEFTAPSIAPPVYVPRFFLVFSCLKSLPRTCITRNAEKTVSRTHRHGHCPSSCEVRDAT